MAKAPRKATNPLTWERGFLIERRRLYEDYLQDLAREPMADIVSSLVPLGVLEEDAILIAEALACEYCAARDAFDHGIRNSELLKDLKRIKKAVEQGGADELGALIPAISGETLKKLRGMLHAPLRVNVNGKMVLAIPIQLNRRSAVAQSLLGGKPLESIDATEAQQGLSDIGTTVDELVRSTPLDRGGSASGDMGKQRRESDDDLVSMTRFVFGCLGIATSSGRDALLSRFLSNIYEMAMKEPAPSQWANKCAARAPKLEKYGRDWPD